jgi:hypothetical protein
MDGTSRLAPEILETVNGMQDGKMLAWDRALAEGRKIFSLFLGQLFLSAAAAAFHDDPGSRA